MKTTRWVLGVLAAAVLAGACSPAPDSATGPSAGPTVSATAEAAEQPGSSDDDGQEIKPQPSDPEPDDRQEEAPADPGAEAQPDDAPADPAAGETGQEDAPGPAATTSDADAGETAPVSAPEEDPIPADQTQEQAAPAADPPAAGVLALLDALPVRPEVARAGYDRDLFRHWIDADGDGCDTRREVLLAEAVTAPGVGGGCRLSGGVWYSAYDGATETGTGRGFDVDHMVPLAEAWDSGASEWGPERREDFANDLGYPDSLVAVSARSNRSKSAQDPAEWQPPDAAARCWYASAWVAVKTRWGLSADQREVDALRGVLTGCDEADLAAPAPSAPATGSGDAPDQPEDTTAPPAEPAEPAEPADRAGLEAALSEIRSKPCGDWGAEDRALAREAPDGYDWGRRDGNNDGVPCE